MIVILLCVLLYSCLLCLTSGHSTQTRSLFVHRGLNVNWNPFNFAHSEASSISTLLLNWISARHSWGRAFWVVWAEGRKIAREIAKPRFREIQMRIGRNRDGNCKRSTHPGNGQTETKFELFALDIWGEILSIWFHDFHPNDDLFLFVSESRPWSGPTDALTPSV